MAITGISIFEDNKVGDSDLLAVHSPLTFLIDVIYTGAIPDVLYCDVYDETPTLLATFKCIPYQDLVPTARRFMFIADSIIRGYMGSFSDFVQSEFSFVHVDDITKVFELKFRDPDAGVLDVSTIFTAIQSSKEFGDSPNLSSIYNNETDTYIAAKNETAYVYFYNDNISNVVSIGERYQVKFIISDSIGFVEDALITITGNSELTDINGEAFFTLANGTYGYSITKTGYVPKTGTLIVSGSNVTLSLTITAQSLEPVQFIVDKKGIDGVFTVDVYTSDGVTLIDSANTTELGNTVTINLELPESYLVEANYQCWHWEKYSEVLTLTNLSSPVTLTPSTELPEVAITFSVTDFDTGDPLESVDITKNGTLPFGDPCYSDALSTSALGVVTTTVRGGIAPGFKSYAYYCEKTGYSVASGSVNVNSSNLAVQVDIQLINQVVVTAPVVTTGIIDDIEKDNFRASGEVVSDGGSVLLTMGFCYVLSPGIPTITDDKIALTPAVGPFNGIIPSLSPLVDYNVRAYASNAEGLSYGGSVTQEIPYEVGGVSANYILNSAFCNFQLENTETVTMRFRVNKGTGFVNTDQIENAGALRSLQIEYDSGSGFVGGETWDLQVVLDGHVSTIASGTL